MTRLDRYTGAVVAAVALAAAGVVIHADALVVAAIVPVGFVVYGSLTSVSVDPDDLTVRRSLSMAGAVPGERVDVELTVTNDGDSPLADLRVVDDVPDALPVVEGSPRGAVALRPGETATVEYGVVANRGEHRFGPLTVRARSLSGADVETVEPRPDGDATVVCSPTVDRVPLQAQTTQFAGRVRTDTGGSGVEFHATREYQHGDPVSRIDWRRLARGGDLTTVEFHERRAARVVLVVDAREVCHVSPRAGVPTGAAMSAFGATRALAALLEEGHEAGVAAFGVSDGVGPAWVPPGSGEEREVRIRRVLEAAADGPGNDGGSVVGPADATTDDGATPRDDVAVAGRPTDTGDGTAAPDGGSDDVELLRERLPPDAQVLFFTPAVDPFPKEVVRELSAYGHGVTVVSPDVTHEDTPGGKLRTVERRLLVEELRADGTATLDWSRDRPLALVLAEALAEVVR